MQKVFNIFDRDQDGSITIEDVQIVMDSLQYLKDELEFPSIEQIKVAFDKFDENRNGKIEFNEFINILKSAGAVSATPPPSTSTSFVNNYVNSNNIQKLNTTSYSSSYNNHNDDATKINFDLNSSSSNTSGDLVKSNMRQLFDHFDKDHDGKITKHELNFVMCNLFPDEVITDQDINEMLHAADIDKNGFIDFDGNYPILLFIVSCILINTNNFVS
jgi:Ca2+-binding EF-hand superfamily protein